MQAGSGSRGEGDLVGRAVNLPGLADYQDGSIVSRTLVNKKAGTVTLFAFDKGQGLSEHTAPYDAVVYVIDGEVDVSISGEKHRVVKDEMIIMPANKPHSLTAVERFKMVLVMIRSE